MLPRVVFTPRRADHPRVTPAAVSGRVPGTPSGNCSFPSADGRRDAAVRNPAARREGDPATGAGRAVRRRFSPSREDRRNFVPIYPINGFIVSIKERK